MNLPCLGNEALYDTALFDDSPTTVRTQAVHQAAALCRTCPAPCEQKVTVDSTPRELVLLEPDWMPPAREGRPEPEIRVPRRRRRQPVFETGRAYVRPAQRVPVWAAMAAEQAQQGHGLADIAADLCVTEGTAARLVEIGQQAWRGVA